MRTDIRAGIEPPNAQPAVVAERAAEAHSLCGCHHGEMPLFEMTPDVLEPVPTTTFAAEQVLERTDLQRLLRSRIEMIVDGVMVVAEEFGAFTDARRRIDLLGVDRDGRLVVIELKRTTDGGHLEQVESYTEDEPIGRPFTRWSLLVLQATRAQADEVVQLIAEAQIADVLDPAIPCLVELCYDVGRRVGKFRLVHDQSNTIPRHALTLLSIDSLPAVTPLLKLLRFLLRRSRSRIARAARSCRLPIGGWRITAGC